MRNQYPNLNDHAIVKLIYQDPEQGLALISEQRFPIVLNSYRIRSLHLHPFQEDDLHAELLEAVWKHAHHFDSKKASLNTWLAGIAYNLYLEQSRKLAPKHTQCEYIEELADSKPTTPSVITVMCIDATRDAVGHLPKRQGILAGMDMASTSGRADTKNAMVAVDANTPGAVHSLRNRYLQNIATPHRHQRLHSLMKQIKK